MCGIAGAFSVSGFFSDSDVKIATGKLSHRGPDADGFWSDKMTILGHRRLSIIDLDSRSTQPMTSASGRYKIIFNGEIYNYIELREQLIKNYSGTPAGQFKTTSDTEVILNLFELKGTKCITELNGMFAMAIYDTHLKKMFLFRDRMGIKPLFYYSDTEGNFFFASELKAITAIDKINFEINSQAVADFLHLGFIPAPKTIYSNIKKLKSGCFLEINKDSISEKNFDTPTQHIEYIHGSEEKIIATLEEKLFESVKIQLRSDVPYGVFLSGGIDSSLLTALASKTVTEKLNTFSIGFKEQSHNEAMYAKAVASYLNTKHHEFIVSYTDALELIPSIPDVYDEPYADPSAVPTMLVSQLARQHVKVVLSGEGGDELFHGYGTMKWASRLNNFPFKQFHNTFSAILNQLPSRYKRIASLLHYSNSGFLPAHIYSQEQYFFSTAEIKAVLAGNQFYQISDYLTGKQKKFFKNISEWSNADTAAADQAHFEFNVTLQDDLLTKVDRASMRYSLEARVPYLDNNVVNYALSIPSKIKTKNGIAKYPLKKILYKHVPQELFNRPKQGFSIPLGKWLRNELAFLITDFLSEQKIAEGGVLNINYVNELVKKFNAGDNYLYNRIWNLIILQKWLLKK